MYYINNKYILLTLGLAFLLLCACDKTEIISCAKPTELTVNEGLDIEGNLTIRDAEGKIKTALGKSLTAKFANTNPDTWMNIASTYQYQTCQLVNSISCGEQSSSDCLDKKKSILDGAYDKILEIKSKQEDIKISACVTDMVSNYQEPKTASTRGGATASSPGVKGGKNTQRESLCYSVGPDQEIISASTHELSCHGGRCSVTAPKISDDKKEVCVIATAWSESKAFGGGGSAQYQLNVIYKNIATTETIRNYRTTCTASLS
ncbi:MAG: hypothetical protein IPM20_06355 [Gammaproteobacteria bacterium]|nr:hypothetical protein [Gammaproteobacteria bacterium]